MEQKTDFKVSSTMKVISNKKIKPHYVVIRIDGKTYSTTFGGDAFDDKDIDACNLQLVETEGIGREDNMWAKGRLTEGENHQKIAAIPFEINIYADEGDLTKIGAGNNFKPEEWEKDICETCGEGHLFCEKCQKHTWHKTLEDGRQETE